MVLVEKWRFFYHFGKLLYGFGRNMAISDHFGKPILAFGFGRNIVIFGHFGKPIAFERFELFFETNKLTYFHHR